MSFCKRPSFTCIADADKYSENVPKLVKLTRSYRQVDRFVLLVNQSSCLQLCLQGLVDGGRLGTFANKVYTVYMHCSKVHTLVFLFTCPSAYWTKARQRVWDASCAGDQPCCFASSTGRTKNLRLYPRSKSTLFLHHLHLLPRLVTVKRQAAVQPGTLARRPCVYRVTKGKLKRP